MTAYWQTKDKRSAHEAILSLVSVFPTEIRVSYCETTLSILGLNKTGEYFSENGELNFSLLEKITNKKRTKYRINAMVLDWNWRYQ